MTGISDTIITNAMRTACAEARKWLGATSPNPPVGAIALDKKGEIIALAAHQHAGEAHAEAKLIAFCREQGLLSRIHTLCVTLEPCNHHGRTPPCTDAILKAGIKRVVIGARDPNTDVAGGGLEKLQQAKIAARLGGAEAECAQLIHAFAYHCKTGKPWITVKRAINRAGTMIPPAGQRTFTGPASLRLGHRLRKKCDAIITGSGTILADDPLFTIRHIAEHQGKRRFLAILDRRRRVPKEYVAAARLRGLDAIIYTDVRDAITDLHNKGAQDVLVEAGPTLSQYFLEAGLWVMSVTVQQADEDIVNVKFNANEPIPFDTTKANLEFMLPT